MNKLDHIRLDNRTHDAEFRYGEHRFAAASASRAVIRYVVLAILALTTSTYCIGCPPPPPPPPPDASIDAGTGGKGGAGTGVVGGSTADSGAGAGGVAGGAGGANGGNGGKNDVTANGGAGAGGVAGGAGGSGKCDNSGSTGQLELYRFSNDYEEFVVRFSEPSALRQSSTLVWDSENGAPDSGSLKVTVPFSAASQKVQVSVTIPATDWSGHTLGVRVRLDSGLSTDFINLGGVKLYVKSGKDKDYVSAFGPWINLNSNNWVTITINLCAPDRQDATLVTSFDPKEINEIGVELATGSIGTYKEATIHIDTFSLE